MIIKLLAVLSLAVKAAVAAQAPPSNLPSQSEMSNPNVTALAEDEVGDIWIGTNRGLNRYNGSSYKIYLEEETEGMDNDNITSICTDTDGRLWVGTSSGISLARKGRFCSETVIRARFIQGVKVWDEGHLMYSTREGLFLADKSGGGIQPFYLDKRLSYNRFMITSDRRIWIRNIASETFTVLDSGGRILREFNVDGSIHGVEEWTDGQVFVLTSTGLLRYATDGTPEALPAWLGAATFGKDILFMAVKDDSAYIGIRGEGIFRIRGESLVREWEGEKLEGISSCRVLLTDDNLWLSLDNYGLTNFYRHVGRNSMPVPFSQRPDALNMFYPIGNGYLLVVTNKGVFRQHLATGAWTALSGNGLDGSDKLGITLRDRYGHLWILAEYNELRRYAQDGDRLVLEASWPVEPSNSIWDDAAGNVCLLQGDRVLRFSQDGRREEIAVSQHPEFWFCGQFPSGKVYFLSDDAVWFLDDSFRFSRFEDCPPDPTCIWEDSLGDWWIGTRNSGIFRRRAADGSIERVNVTGADKTVNSISGDRDGTIWAASRFDYIRISENGDKIVVMKNPEGLSVANNTNSLGITDNGTAVFGTRERFFFFPKDYSASVGEIPLMLDGIIANGNIIQDEICNPLVLGHRTRQLMFYFSGRNFNPGLKPAYQYKLDGYDDEWIPAGTALRAGYSGLKSGKYTFRVRAQGPDGLWEGDELRQDVRIRTSPWRSWPLLLLYLLAGASLVYLAIRQYIGFRMNKEKLEVSEQEKTLLEQISQERTTFFTNVSHEFRTPLSLIYGPVRELSESETLTDKDRELVGLIGRNAERMMRLTDQFLHFNRSSAEQDKLSITRTDLAMLLRNMLENFAYMFSQKDLRVTADLPKEMIAWCDREKVERIVFNLLSNAVKYTPEHGEIMVRAAEKDGTAVLSVADTGIGISQDKRERIFQRFERLGETVGGTLPTGFGIGLSYARHLAQLHKGELGVTDNDPIGSVFTFTFPLLKEAYADETLWDGEESEDSPAAVPEGAAPVNGKGVNILVVEDNPDMREYIKGFLKEDYRVMTADDGEQAWKCIRISAPDLIVSDVMMPFKDGYTLCKEIKNDPEYCHIPIILLTAKADMENHIHGLDLGADGYLGKPFDPAYLSALVRNLIAGRKRLQGILADRTSSTMDEVGDDTLSAQDRAFMEKCYRIIDSHIDDEEFGVTTLSMEMGMSRTSIFSKMKALTGQSPQTFLTSYRLNRAMELLKTRDFNISEVAYKVGFSTLTGFSRSFKNKFGIPPSAV